MRGGNMMVRSNSRVGFTLVELLVVIIILAIAAAIVVPMASSASGMQLRSATTMLAADMEYAKSMAISRGQMYSVVFDKDAETYQIQDQDGTVIPHPVKKGFPYVVNFGTDRRLDQVQIGDANFDLDPAVTFDYLGSPYHGVPGPSIGPLNSGLVTLQVGSEISRVKVEPVTGFVSILP